jgi:hypothetical protein
MRFIRNEIQTPKTLVLRKKESRSHFSFWLSAFVFWSWVWLHFSRRSFIET